MYQLHLLHLFFCVFLLFFTFCSSEEAKSIKKVRPDYCFQQKLTFYLGDVDADYTLSRVIQQKTLIRQFSNGEERLQKKQPIRNQDDSKLVFV